MHYTVCHFINNTLINASEGKLQDLYNPATGAVCGQVALASGQEVEQAVAAAEAALPVWSALPVVRRTRILFKYKELLEQHLDELAALISKEHGKTINDAKGSILRGIEVVEFACGAPNLMKGWFSEEVGTGIDSHTMRQPLGVCVGITPFNFPAMIPLWMFPLAVVCGNTFVLKPSEKDPSCALRLAELFAAAGAPAGVLNVINGDQHTVNALLYHPKVAAVSFVGSTAVAEYVQKTAIAQGKRVQAFGGAKNHAVVMPDADLEQVAEAIVGAAYGSAGQRCMAISAVVAVGEQVAQELIRRMKPKVEQLRIGPATAPDIDMGPLNSRQQLEKVKASLETGIKEGARLVVDGRTISIPGHEEGYFLGGCLFDQVTPNMQIYQEELFGPVLVILQVPDFEAALTLVNQHAYGNGTVIFTRDGATARAYATRVKVGMVGINVPIPVPAPYHAFGGWKRSIFADIHLYGTESISFYTRLKTVTTRWPGAVVSSAEFVMPTLS